VTLRLRLALALVGLATVGMAIFGVTTYSLYSHSQYQQLDKQLRAAVRPSLNKFPDHDTQGFANSNGYNGSTPPGGSGGTGGGPGGGPGGLTPVAFTELRNASGTVIGTNAFSDDVSPAIPRHLSAPGADGIFLDVDSTSGSTRWRVYVSEGSQSSATLKGTVIIVAQPLTDVDDALGRLVLIEVAAGLGLVLILGGGSWLILRRGLRPLEQMAGSARSITSGDLSQRVTPADGKAEVGQLGLALNTMLTEIEDAFRERDATERRLRQFLADASHELRTPLTSIQGFAELFRMGADEDRVQLEVIFRRIEEESARMKTLVEDLLLLARLDETRPSERGPVDLSVLAADACTDAVATDPGRPVILDAPAPIVVAGDRDHLRQAIANLVTNAIKHTPSGGAIEVATRVESGAAVVSVRDHGPGLDPDAIEHVFDRFWQADRARVGTGSGLGLSIVAAIADEHRGTVDVANVSVEDGGGAVFTLRLPVNTPA
jgi:two-component system OmpR family sensor kinase